MRSQDIGATNVLAVLPRGKLPGKAGRWNRHRSRWVQNNTIVCGRVPTKQFGQIHQSSGSQTRLPSQAPHVRQATNNSTPFHGPVCAACVHANWRTAPVLLYTHTHAQACFQPARPACASQVCARFDPSSIINHALAVAGTPCLARYSTRAFLVMAPSW